MIQPPSINDTLNQPLMVLTRDAVRQVDRLAEATYGIPGIVLMENAARGLLEEALVMLDDSIRRAHVLIICGSGNNGGDGYALARHLHNHAIDVSILPLGTPRAGTDAALNATICERMNIRQISADDLGAVGKDVALIVDAIFGTGLDRDVTGTPAHVIAVMNEMRAPILAVDVPSGLDCESGRPLGEAVRAAVTVALVGLKPGYLQKSSEEYLGRVVVKQIGAPIELLKQFGTSVAEYSPGS